MALIGTKTNVIAAAAVTDRDQHDSWQFIPLFEAGAQIFTTTEVSADNVYSGRPNIDAVVALGHRAGFRGVELMCHRNARLHFATLNSVEEAKRLLPNIARTLALPPIAGRPYISSIVRSRL